jgi:hypothetical protein
MNRLPRERERGILDRPPRPVAEIALLFVCVIFILCNVPRIACVALCAVFCLSVVRVLCGVLL